MCGIAGYWDPDGLNEDHARGILTAMTDVIRHRGPDDSGVWMDAQAGIALGFRRLSILDLSMNGHQPMESETGRYVIVFNGEIYNFQELRRQLLDLGHRFRGRSDTEVLLAGVSAWGIREALERFNGMFAFALWDRQQRTLHLARDRAGEKPLYYGWMGRTLLFGSELKALRAHPAFCGRIDRNALALFFRRGYVPGPYSIYVGVQKLPPGTLLTLHGDQAAPSAAPIAYWSARAVAERGVADPCRDSAKEMVEQLHELLRDAVKIRMEADVPLGVFLSGGIDSSTVVSLMQEQSTRPVRTFTIGFRENRYNEAQHAAVVARHLGTEHTELYVTPDEALAVIPRLPVLYDEPFADTSQIPTFLVSEMTRRHVTVSLSGDAGDELFGGYRRYRLGPAIWRGIGWIPMPLRRAAAAALSPGSTPPGRVAQAVNRLTRKWTGKRSFSERLRQTAEILPVQSPVALYHYMMSFWKQPASLVPGARDLLLPVTDPTQWPDLGGIPEHIMMYLDTVAYLPDDILVKLDRASMGVSLEARVPLLDHRVIEFAWRAPLSLKLRGGVSKWLLRQVLYEYVPRQLVERPKKGFGMPIADWLRGPLRDWAEALLEEHRLRGQEMLDPGPIRQKWAEHLSGETRWDYHLWTVLMFQSWVEAQSRHQQPGAPAGAGRLRGPARSEPAAREADHRGVPLTAGVSLLGQREPRVDAGAPPRPLIVELVGPAGAGKTAALRALGQRADSVQPGLRIDRLRYLPIIIWHTLALASTGFELLEESPRSWWPGMRHLVRLRTLHAVLAREASPSHRAIILDEGPVFSLSRLSMFQNASLGNGRLARAWRTILDRWAGTLDVVIWLDAPDPVLAQRIRSRSKFHQVKEATDQQLYEFLGRYRSAYREVLARLTAAGHVRLVEMDTDGESADQAAAKILAVLERMQAASSGGSV